MNFLQRLLDWFFPTLVILYLLSADAPQPGDAFDRAHAYTRAAQFSYESWTVDAVWQKAQQSALGLPGYMAREDQAVVVMEYVRITGEILNAENRLTILFTDPSIADKDAASAHVRAQLNALYIRQQSLAPLAESIIQAQVAVTLNEFGLSLGGQTIPPVMYHVSPLPLNLVISRRDKIEQIAAISLEPDVALDQQIYIEDKVAKTLGYSTLIVPVGGIGVYPTMVMETTNFQWQVNTVVHEWTHNFLSLRPLGILYGATPELRTINETVASIVESEVGPRVIQNYYPQLRASSSAPGLASWTQILPPADEAPFDYRAEMHTTRVHVDELLADGKIEQAETYMEQRRQFFWNNGYAIRKLNQAFFAFHGAYADVPGGAAGEDPVGPAVRALREQSASLADFLNTISWMTSFEELLAAVGQ